MSERKVLNKYYPPDFDPSKIPRMKLPKNRQYTVRLMAPFNMRCKTCGEYIYKGKKFNARKEDVEGEDYFGIRIYRFYIKCTRCLQEISFKTDPKNTDYEIEAGATRNFMALKLAEEQAQREEDERKEEEANNPMKLLENRTQQSKQELELLESLEDLKDLNRRQRSIDYDAMLSQYDTKEAREKLLKLQEEQDEQFIKSVFGGNKRVVEEEIVETVDEDSCGPPPIKKSTVITKSLTTSIKNQNSTDTTKPLTTSTNNQNSTVTTKSLTITANKNQSTTDTSWNVSVGRMSKKSLSGLVRIKKQESPVTSQPKQETVTNNPSSTKPNLSTSSNNPEVQKPSSLLSLGAYSDSEDSGSN